jgi:hypothetical protein
MEPLVPVTVTVPDPTVAAEEATNWKAALEILPGTVTANGPVGIVETPLGSPERVNVTVPVNPFNACGWIV